MIVYHIDRTCLITKGQMLSTVNNYNLENIFDVYNNSLSAHGIQYLTKNPKNNIDSFIWEISVEYVRLLKYPNYPSRFKCLFAVEDLVQLQKWENFFGYSSHKVARIECSKYHKFDAMWITKPGVFFDYVKTNKFNNVSFASYCYFADMYWSGQPTSNPLWELLVELPCKCVDILED